MTVEITSFRPSDHEGVCALWSGLEPDPTPWNEPAAVIARKRTVQGDLFLVARSNGRVVGTVLCGFDGCRAFVHNVAVDPAFRRRGIASRLMAEAERRATARGAPKLNLQILDGNEDAVAFYRALGYKVEYRISMTKVLDGEPHALRCGEE